MANRLAGLGSTVRAVSRRRPLGLVNGVDWLSTDLAAVRAAIDAAAGATVVYQCLNAPYTRWPQLLPPLHRNVLVAAERAGALLVTLELLAAAEAGRVRMAIGRASDFFGAAVTESTLGIQVFGNALAGKRANFIGNPNLLHTYSYVPDIAAGLVTLDRG